MTVPIHRLKKTEIMWLNKHKCKHGHTYLEHWSCYEKENPDNMRTGFLDIEASNLKGDFGICLCYCIKDEKSDKIYSRIITKEELRTSLDTENIKQCIEDMSKFDRLIGYYSSRFDIPFLRTRAVILGVDFPEFGSIIHNDLYFLIRNRFSLSSKRLDAACRALLGSTSKTRLDGVHWIKALSGDKEALDYILDHCKHDVLELERLYKVAIDFGRRTDTSL